MLMTPDDDYVERYITFRGSPHGAETYYGRHFFYRSAARRIYVITVPPLGRLDALPHESFDPADYPTLASTCALIERIGTRLYTRHDPAGARGPLRRLPGRDRRQRAAPARRAAPRRGAPGGMTEPPVTPMPEIVVGLVGAVGTDLYLVAELAGTILRSFDYRVEDVISLSSVLNDVARAKAVPTSPARPTSTRG